VAFCRGLQGDHPVLESGGTPKHFAVHSGPEGLRHSFDAVVSQKDLRETYLPVPRLYHRGQAESIMAAYNAPTRALLRQSTLLRQSCARNGFGGFVVSELLAIRISTRVTGDQQLCESAALRCTQAVTSTALRLQSHSRCGGRWLVREEDLDTSLRRLFRARMRLACSIARARALRVHSLRDNDCDQHRALARTAARRLWSA